jgi:REP element-mobilizing transposase RayT
LAKLLLLLPEKSILGGRIMGRPIRLEYPGAVYHIYARGNRKEPIFLDDEDRILFLKIFGDAVHRYNWVCHAYCLMGNHYHLLIEIPEGILNPGMQYLNSLYARKFNRKHNLVGHLFQGRYGADLIEGNRKFLLAAHYICRNSIEANIVEKASQWPWSSFCATVGLQEPQDFLLVDDVLSCLSDDRSTAQDFFDDLVHTPIRVGKQMEIEITDKEIKNPDVARRLRPLIDIRQSLAPVARKQRMQSRPLLEDLFKDTLHSGKKLRNRLIKEAFINYGYSQSEIGAYLGLHTTTISRIINKRIE